jgi:hypothetical protein
MTPPTHDHGNERRLTLHFPPLKVRAGKSSSVDMPLVATFGLCSDEWLRPEHLVMADESSARGFEVVTLSVRHNGFEGHEVVLPMTPEESCAPPSVIYRLESREVPPCASSIFLKVKNLTDKTLIFSAGMTLRTVATRNHYPAPFRPIGEEEPRTPLFTLPREEQPGHRRPIKDGLAHILIILKSLRQEYAALKEIAEETAQAEADGETADGLYPARVFAKPDPLWKIIRQTLRQGAEVAAFPVRAASLLSNRSLDDLKQLLSKKKGS